MSFARNQDHQFSSVATPSSSLSLILLCLKLGSLQTMDRLLSVCDSWAFKLASMTFSVLKGASCLGCSACRSWVCVSQPRAAWRLSNRDQWHYQSCCSYTQDQVQRSYCGPIGSVAASAVWTLDGWRRTTYQQVSHSPALLEIDFYSVSCELQALLKA